VLCSPPLALPILRLPPQQVRQAIAASFDIDVGPLAVASAEPEDFLVTFPDVATTDRVFNGGSPPRSGLLSVFQEVDQSRTCPCGVAPGVR
jgi:hypothetical protein